MWSRQSASAICGTVRAWKIRQSVSRVRNQNQGTISARYSVKEPPVAPWAMREMMPLISRGGASPPRAMRTVTLAPSMAFRSISGFSETMSRSYENGLARVSRPEIARSRSSSSPSGVAIESSRWAWV